MEIHYKYPGYQIEISNISCTLCKKIGTRLEKEVSTLSSKKRITQDSGDLLKSTKKFK